ncbi:glutaminase A [Cesiribacter andamanensis]|uniref:Glutaminase n=1 Tax=Cesiribacter andamanensis AMV16 TaxID=1279009 RepID=M7NHJ6_9BACT|nr:glutaminase A [Cesiribacter andamanensis]EMR01255.1 Glutaminase [Cesiribacter andamanensis AMV16]
MLAPCAYPSAGFAVSLVDGLRKGPKLHIRIPMKDRAPKTRASKNTPSPAEKAEARALPDDLQSLFDSLDTRKKGTLNRQQLLGRLQDAGIQSDDARLEKKLADFLRKDAKKDPGELDAASFAELLEGRSQELVKKALLNQLSIPDFKQLCQDVERYYTKTKKITEGEAGSKAEAKCYGISVCTIDGQRFRLGDHERKFMLQSACKPINYAIALHERGEQTVHRHVGREPSGRGYNGLVLNQEGLPHNPMINAGAIMTCSLIKPERSVAKRLKHVLDIWSRLSGNTPVDYNREIHENGDMGSSRNMALSYYMKEKGAFPQDTDLYKTIEFYRKSCSIEVTTDQLALAAATLANGGRCPTTGDSIFKSDDVRDCLSLMLTCGMYDYSGEFAFLVGLPAKSGVSGALMVVVPGLMGIAIYSPPIDDHGNTVRGVEFCKELVKEYSFHVYDHVVDPAHEKKDPRRPRRQEQQ